MTEPTDDIILRLTAYLDGELTPQERASLEQEARGNPELAALLEQARDAMGVVAALPEIQAPEHFELAVQRRIRRRSGGRFFAGQRVRQTDSSILFILIALTVLLGWFLFMRQGQLGPLLDEIAPRLPDQDEPADEGSSSQLPPEPLRPSTTPSASAAAPAPASAPQARPSDPRVIRMNPGYRVPRYVLHARSDLTATALEQELVRRVGRQKLIAGDSRGEWRVVDDAADPGEWAVRLQELGTIEEQRVLVNSPRDTVPLTVLAASP